MIRCRTCLIPDTRPDTHFDDSGQCSACRSYAYRPSIDWVARKQELIGLLDRFDGRVLVPSSGGKDSTYQVITLLEMGADVTIATARTCHLTEIGRRNIDNLSRYARTIEVVPNMAERARLNKLGLEMVGDISWPEHVSIFTTPFRVAVSEKIPLIMYGENPQNQYGGPMDSTESKQMTKRWTQEFGGFLGLRPADIRGMDMSYYQLPSDKDMANLEAHFLGQYAPWDSHHNAAVAIEHGMETFSYPPSVANYWEHENLDNAQTGIHDYFMYLKYGFGRACQQISVDIRSGLISREDGESALKAYDGILPEWYAGVLLDDILEGIGMDRKQFETVVEQFRCSHDE